MRDFGNLFWIEWRKAVRSRMPMWTTLGALFMPLGITFLLLVAKNPDISKKLGLVSVKANLFAYAATDWPAYFSVYAEIISAGGLIFFILVISWVFGREWVDGTLKDLMAVPVSRAGIVMAKFAVTALWCTLLAGIIYLVGLSMGMLLQLPGWSVAALWQGSAVILVTTLLVIAVILPFALVAGIGRGYLLPIGAAILTMMFVNFSLILGLGESFPWAIPLLYAQGDVVLAPFSYLLVVLTAIAGVSATVLWWKYADQNK